ncbi:MAG: hypothetical protein DMF63_18680 [Acidobacteria bacterium]|nr:MAG: hypothetical protein DMF63_18680 [Acidobacteriota bacterium]
MTLEFENLKHDPDLESQSGPGGTLIFLDGDSYCVVGPEFISVEESDCYAFGETKKQAIANYAARIRSRGYP